MERSPLVVDHGIQKGVKAQLQAAIVLFHLDESCFQALIALLQQSRSVIMGNKFTVESPALQIAAIPEQLPGRPLLLQTAPVAVDVLIQVPGIALMGQGGIKLQSGGCLFPVDIDDIVCCVFNGGGQIEGRVAVVLPDG